MTAVHDTLDATALPPLPSATGLSHVRVYDTVAPDGKRSCSPHVHLACTELYYVVAGSGAVEFLSARGFETVPLRPGKVVYFTPGVIHRLVNEGDLEVLVLMENSGLPDRGDAVLTFPSEYLDDPAAYAAASTLPGGNGDGPTEAGAAGIQEAKDRRDLAVRGFTDLAGGFERSHEEGARRLRAFYRQAGALVRPALGAWEEVVEDGAARTLGRTREHLAAIYEGSEGHLQAGVVVQMPDRDEQQATPSTCGLRWRFLPEGVSSEAAAEAGVTAGGC